MRQRARAAGALANGDPPTPEVAKRGDTPVAPVKDPQRLVEDACECRQPGRIDRARGAALHEADVRLAAGQAAQRLDRARPRHDVEREAVLGEDLPVLPREREVGPVFAAGGHDESSRRQRARETIRDCDAEGQGAQQHEPGEGRDANL